MSFLRDVFGPGSRPYPLDRERWERVMLELIKKRMSISGLAKAIGIARTCASETISGRRLSSKTEQRIAEYLGKPADELFPSRTVEEIRQMRQAEAAQQAAAVKEKAA